MVYGFDSYNQMMTSPSSGCYSLDEKMGQTYIHYEVANTLAARDYKQPQAVIYEKEDSKSQNTNE